MPSILPAVEGLGLVILSYKFQTCDISLLCCASTAKQAKQLEAYGFVTGPGKWQYVDLNGHCMQYHAVPSMLVQFHFVYGDMAADHTVWQIIDT